MAVKTVTDLVINTLHARHKRSNWEDDLSLTVTGMSSPPTLCPETISARVHTVQTALVFTIQQNNIVKAQWLNWPSMGQKVKLHVPLGLLDSEQMIGHGT